MENRNTKLAVKRSLKELSNNILIYIPVILFLIYAGNKFYGIEMLKGVSLLLPTALTVFATVSSTKPVMEKETNFYSKALTSFVIGACLNTVLSILVILLSAFNMQFNFLVIALNIILAGLLSAFFTVYDYSSNYKKEYRNIFVTLIFILSVLIISLLKLPFDVNLMVGLLLGTVSIFAIFNLNHVKVFNLDKAKIMSNIKKTLAVENFKVYLKHYILILQALLIPYIVLASNGFVLAGLTTIMLIITSLLFFTWHSVKYNLFLTSHGIFKTGTKKFRIGLIMLVSLSFVLAFSFILLPQQIMSLFTLPIEYSAYFGSLGLAILPFTLAMLMILIFNDVILIKGYSLELTLTSIITLGVLVTSRIPQLQLGLTLFVLYTVFMTWLLIKATKKVQ